MGVSIFTFLIKKIHISSRRDERTFRSKEFQGIHAISSRLSHFKKDFEGENAVASRYGHHYGSKLSTLSQAEPYSGCEREHKADFMTSSSHRCNLPSLWAFI